MGDYFKPWRRKIGVATLVMACVFAAGWVNGQRNSRNTKPRCNVLFASVDSGSQDSTDNAQSIRILTAAFVAMAVL